MEEILNPPTELTEPARRTAAALCRLPGESPPGWTWQLPGGPACARWVRAVLAGALAGLGVARDPAMDAQLMVSELATNAYQHAGDHGPHELWLYLAGSATGPGRAGLVPELRCGIFDRLAVAGLPGYSWTSGDYGRGLNIVAELSGGRWGRCREHARHGGDGPGKVVWFAVPAPVPPGAGERLRGPRPAAR